MTAGAARLVPAARASRVLLATLGCLWLGGCGIFGPRDNDPNVEYSVAQQRELLELPPNLSLDERRALLRIPADSRGPISRTTLLPEPESTRVVRHGAMRWLEARADPRELWPALREFWTAQGIGIAREEPLLGVIETVWVESREVPASKGIASFFGGRRSDIQRHRYRLRVERLEDGSGVRLFVSHRMLSEEVGVEGSNRETTETIWVRRAADPEREAEILNRLLVFLGVREQRAREILSERDLERLRARAYVEEDADGNVSLVVADTLHVVWPQTGQALEEIGLDVERSLRRDARYDVRFSGELPAGLEPPPEEGGEEPGFFSRLFSGAEAERSYQVYLLEEPGQTRITLSDAGGAAPWRALERELIRRLQTQLQ